MLTQLTSSIDFAALVKKLQQSPNDIYLKRMVIQHLPQIKEWAKNNALGLFHLAHAYAPNSMQYKQAMMQSADLGCTNAMLVVSQFLAQSKNPEDQQKAVHYLKMIEQAGDTYIQSQLAKTGLSKHRFFAAHSTGAAQKTVSEQLEQFSP